MKNKVLNFINKNKILQYGDSVILGVSGGADSICMLYLLKDISSEMNLTLYVVHINHHIRGKQAQNDADYVKDVCRKLNVDFKQIDADVPLMVKQTGMTEEEAGRQARYKAFFERAIEVKIKEKKQAKNQCRRPVSECRRRRGIAICLSYLYRLFNSCSFFNRHILPVCFFGLRFSAFPKTGRDKIVWSTRFRRARRTSVRRAAKSGAEKAKTSNFKQESVRIPTHFPLCGTYKRLIRSACFRFFGPDDFSRPETGRDKKDAEASKPASSPYKRTAETGLGGIEGG